MRRNIRSRPRLHHVSLAQLIAFTSPLKALLIAVSTVTPRRCGLLRAVLMEGAAPGLGLAPNPSLRELAEAAPVPWDDLFALQRLAFLDIADEIRAQASANKQLLHRGAVTTRDLLERVRQERWSGRGANQSENCLLVDQAM